MLSMFKASYYSKFSAIISTFIYLVDNLLLHINTIKEYNQSLAS